MSSFFGCQPIEQLWSLLNLNGLVLAIIEICARMSFLDVAYARSTILEDYIRNADKGARRQSSHKLELKIDVRNRKTESKFVAIKGPHCDGVRAIVKYKPAAFLKAKKARRLQRKPDSRERHLEMVRVQKERRGMGLQGKELTGKGTGDMLEEMIRMCRERWGIA
ncbi:hypothetical protein HOY80DRAFT_1099396 [Tuber brumale]|nr:hypothetical protein HOY80DRAFT_1099396 [Tuber brumale]